MRARHPSAVALKVAVAAELVSLDDHPDAHRLLLRVVADVRRLQGDTWKLRPSALQHSTQTNFGLLTQAALPHALRLRAGIFRSDYEIPLGFSDLLMDIDAAGAGQHLIVADRDLSFAATSGEIRLERTFVGRKISHRLYLAGRARSEDRRYGGSDVIDLGATSILAPALAPAPRLGV